MNNREIDTSDKDFPIPKGYEIISHQETQSFSFDKSFLERCFILNDTKRIGWQDEDVLNLIKDDYYPGRDWVACLVGNLENSEKSEIEKWNYTFLIGTIYRKIETGELFAPMLYLHNKEEHGLVGWNCELWPCNEDNLEKFPVAVVRKNRRHSFIRPELV